MPARTIVIGLDGATLDVIEPLAREGRIPNLCRIMDQGSFGKLRSTHPPSSSVAWPSFMTGKNPGKHSIFYFNAKPYGTYYSEPVTSTNIKSKTLWEELSEAGQRVAVVNVPMTYPPRKVNGLMITGLGTPPAASHYSYPQEISREIENALGARLQEVRWTEYDDQSIPQFVQDVVHNTECTYQMADLILQREPWDFFMIVFTGPDRIQHRLWDYLDYNNPRFSKNMESDSKFRHICQLITDYFISLDRILGELIDKAGDHANVIVLSDHGAGNHFRVLDLNNLLFSWDYLKYHEKAEMITQRRFLKSVLKKMGFSLNLLRRIAKVSKLRFDYYKYLEKSSTIVSKIDWERTRAFCYTACSVYINVKDRERHGIVDPGAEYENIRDELISKLTKLRDPLTNKNIIKEVKRKEDVYSGAYLKDAPDLIITDSDESYDFSNLLFSDDGHRSIFTDLDSKHQGTHRYDGFYAILGEKIRQNFRFDEAHIMDLFPTILHLMELPIPEDVDGKVLLDIFESFDHEIRFSERTSYDESSADDLTDEDREKIVEELKGLGYM